MNNKYSLGGSIGGLIGSGIGTLIAPGVGTKVGGMIGSTIGGQFGEDPNEQLKQAELEAQQRIAQAQYDSQTSQSKIKNYSSSVNNLVNPITQGYMYGGFINPTQSSPSILNGTNLNTFGNGGSHDSNPHGGIPQGMGSNGKMNTVEENEVSVKLGKDKRYIFSDRLIFN